MKRLCFLIKKQSELGLNVAANLFAVLNVKKKNLRRINSPQHYRLALITYPYFS